VRRLVPLLERCVQPWETRAWPGEGSAPASDYTVGHALLASVSARAAGLAVQRGVVDRLAKEASSRLERLTQNPEEGAPERMLAEAPWLLYALARAEEGRGRDSLLVEIDTIESLFGRRARAPVESRILLGLALGSVRARPDAAAIRKGWPTLSQALLLEIRDRETRRTGRHVWIDSGAPDWGDGIGGDVRATAFYLRFLSIADPSDPDLPGVVAWLLDQRRPSLGAWSNHHGSALALDAVAATVPALEGPISEVSGRVAIGTTFEEFRFRGGERTWEKETPIRELLRPDGAAGVGTAGVSTAGVRTAASSQVRVETDGRRAVYYAVSLDTARPALGEPAREEGFIVERGYVDAQGRPFEEDRIPAGEPLFVHLTLVVSRDARAVVLDDPLAAGIEPLQLRFQNTPRTSMADAPENEQEATESTALWIVHRELTDRSVRLFAQDVQAGIYHVYYPAIASTAGVYGVPGARAESMYSPEIYGTSEPRSIRIESRR
jgi:hypothetical protein